MLNAIDIIFFVWRIQGMHIVLAELNETILIQLIVLRVKSRVVFTIEANGKESEVYDSGHMDNDPAMHDVRILNSYLGHGVNTLSWTLENTANHGNDGDAWHLSFKVVAKRLFKNIKHDEIELESWEKRGHGGAPKAWSGSLDILY
jgi:hypothetical protein